MLQTISSSDPPGTSHNLVGQRLGRKGLETRERILGAMMISLHAETDEQVTLTSVARAASVGMTTLYLYFPDIGDLLLAALARVMEGADVAFVDRLRERWPDDLLDDHCRDFMHAHHRFWRRHARVLHMRNSCADASDLRFLRYRQIVSRPILDLLVRQMDGVPEAADAPCVALAMVVMAGFERIASMITNPNFQLVTDLPTSRVATSVDQLIDAEARLMAIAIRDQRARRSPPPEWPTPW